MKKPLHRLVLPVFLLSCSSLAFAGPVTTYSINFEQYAAIGNGMDVGSYYAATDDVTFTNAMQLVAPDYDDIDYPTHSGVGLISDEGNGNPTNPNDFGDPILLSFSTGMGDVTGWYTDPYGVTVTAYDSLGNVISTFSGAANDGTDAQFAVYASSGLDPIASISIEDDSDASFSTTVDDISFTTTPEPGSFVLLGTGLLGLAGALRRKFAR